MLGGDFTEPCFSVLTEARTSIPSLACFGIMDVSRLKRSYLFGVGWV